MIDRLRFFLGYNFSCNWFFFHHNYTESNLNFLGSVSQTGKLNSNLMKIPRIEYSPACNTILITADFEYLAWFKTKQRFSLERRGLNCTDSYSTCFSEFIVFQYLPIFKKAWAWMLIVTCKRYLGLFLFPFQPLLLTKLVEILR